MEKRAVDQAIEKPAVTVGLYWTHTLSDAVAFE